MSRSRRSWVVVFSLALLAGGACLLFSASNSRLASLISIPRTEESAIDSRVVQEEVDLLTERELTEGGEALRRNCDFYQPIVDWLLQTAPAVLRDPIVNGRSEVISQQIVLLEVLARAGPRARSADAVLERLASDSGNQIQQIATIALRRVRGTPVSEILTLPPMVSPTPLDQQIRGAIMLASYMSNSPPELLPLFRRGLESDGKNERGLSAYGLQFYGPEARELTPLLQRLLTDSSGEVRAEAAVALGHVSRAHTREAVAAILEQLRTNGAAGAFRGLELFAHAGPDAAAAVPFLKATLASEDFAMVRGLIGVALWRIRHEADAEVVSAVADGLSSPFQRIQVSALDVVAEMGSDAAAAVPKLERLSHHPRIRIRRKALEALAVIRKQSAGVGRP
jgi:hypothetical protein